MAIPDRGTRRDMKINQPITVKLGDLRIIVDAPEFKLTPEQEAQIEKWWRGQIETEMKKYR